jgi:L-rhamnose isomerase
LGKPSIETAFGIAVERYAGAGVDVRAALDALKKVSLSVHCWQGDDVGGFESEGAALSGGGLAVTGRHPGKAGNIGELRDDLQAVYSLIPGRHRLNLHAMYGDFGGKKTDRDAIGTEHFKSWVEWARARRLGLDFNATCFNHPMAESGFTLSSTDKTVRRFWIEHVRRCREIGAWMGAELGTPCVHNLWIPDGAKDATVRRFRHREILRAGLDEIYATQWPKTGLRDSVESKLFGIGSEAYVVGSHEFYLG